MSSFDNLLSQIDSFIRKYYKNEMIKGLILFIGIFIFSFLFVILLEYFGRFNSIVRTFMFFAFVILNLLLLGNYFFLPLLKIFSFGKRINRNQASNIIGKFFPDISDRLLNTLQLNDSLNNNNVVNFELIRASVHQRSKSLSVIPFSNGIDLKKNLSRLKYILPIIFVLLLISIFFPTIVKQGTNRVVNFNQEFIPESPFSFILKSSISSIQEGEDLPIELILKGKFMLFLLTESI